MILLQLKETTEGWILDLNKQIPVYLFQSQEYKDTQSLTPQMVNHFTQGVIKTKDTCCIGFKVNEYFKID